jgi:hypothetical protein
MVPIQILESSLSCTGIQDGGGDRDAPLTRQKEIYCAIALVDAVARCAMPYGVIDAKPEYGRQ